MNKLIEEDMLRSELLGQFKYDPTKERTWTKEYGWSLSKVQFRSSWDWLMPIYYKILGIINSEELNTEESVAQFNVIVDRITDENSISEVFKEIVHFIEIYNDEKRHKTKGDS